MPCQKNKLDILKRSEYQKTMENEPNKKIAISNHLLTAKWPKLSIYEQRLILYMLCLVDRKDVDFKTYRIYVKDIKKIFGSKNKRIYRDLDSATEGMMQKIIKWTDPNFSGLKKVAWCSFAHLVEGKGYIKLRFDSALKPFLLALKGNFTQCELKSIMTLKGHYSLRVYQILKYYYNLKGASFTVELEKLKETIGVISSNYLNFAAFNRRVLTPAQKDINSKTDIKFEFLPVKTGRKVTSLDIKITPPLKITQIKPNEELENRLRNISFEGVEKLRAVYRDDIILQVLDNLDFEAGYRDIQNPAGWVRDRLLKSGKKSYKPTASFADHLAAEAGRRAEVENAVQKSLKDELHKRDIVIEQLKNEIIDIKIASLTSKNRSVLETEAAEAIKKQGGGRAGLKTRTKIKIRELYELKYGEKSGLENKTG